MLEDILNSNPFALLAVGVVIVFILMFVFVRPDKKKSKSSKSTDKKQESTTKQEKTDDGEKEKTEKDDNLEKQTIEASDDDKTADELSTAKTKKKVKKAKIKPEITQVYQRTEKKQVTEEQKTDDGISEEMLGKAQFVNTSKKVSKFAGFKEDVVQEQISDDGLISEEMSRDIAGDCDDCKRIIKHFDHSRRLSKIIKEDSFDQMFMEHLTEHYMNIDVDRHLRDIDEKIYERASELLSNSDTKVLVEDDSADIPVQQIKNDKDFMKSWLETRRMQERANLISSAKEEYEEIALDRMATRDVNINAKNLVVASVVMNRKSLRRNKK